jgi:hypothetical protein
MKVETMPETQETNSDQNRANDKKKWRPSAWLWFALYGALVLTGLIVGGLFFTVGSDRVRFWTENLLTASILAAIIVQALIYRRQWKAMQDSLTKTRNLVAQNERAIKAAEDNVKTVEETAIYANRAYLRADYAMMRGSAGVRPYLRIENSGNTPANDVRLSYSCDFRDSPPYTDYGDGMVAYDVGFNHQAKVGLIAPKGFELVPPPDTKTLTASEREQWRADGIKLYIWGVISYEDIFNKPRRTQFTFSQVASSPKGEPCEYGNRAD